MRFPVRLAHRRHNIACLLFSVIAISGSSVAAAGQTIPVNVRPALQRVASDDVPQLRAAYSPASCVIAVAAATPTWSARRIAFRAPRSADELSANLQCLLEGSVRTGRWGVIVASLSRGDTILSLDAGTHFGPASTQKLFTSALALDQLGPDHQFRTNVLRSGEIDASGVLNGNLILQGGGDPAFSNRFVNGNELASVDLLAE